ncbi:Uncharacterised protein [Pseudomonas aeruginosa]|nr:Uncharacterised protein [Pseudomonas aeruginosa]
MPKLATIEAQFVDRRSALSARLQAGEAERDGTDPRTPGTWTGNVHAPPVGPGYTGHARTPCRALPTTSPPSGWSRHAHASIKAKADAAQGDARRPFIAGGDRNAARCAPRTPGPDSRIGRPARARHPGRANALRERTPGHRRRRAPERHHRLFQPGCRPHAAERGHQPGDRYRLLAIAVGDAAHSVAAARDSSARARRSRSSSTPTRTPRFGAVEARIRSISGTTMGKVEPTSPPALPTPVRQADYMAWALLPSDSFGPARGRCAYCPAAAAVPPASSSSAGASPSGYSEPLFQMVRADHAGHLPERSGRLRLRLPGDGAVSSGPRHGSPRDYRAATDLLPWADLDGSVRCGHRVRPRRAGLPVRCRRPREIKRGAIVHFGGAHFVVFEKYRRGYVQVIDPRWAAGA